MMANTEYQVLRVKPRDLEDALNELSRGGWEIHSILPAERYGSGFGAAFFLLFGRGTLEVTEYHLVARRERA